ncbi:MAG: methylated-DNA--[protein]-cysteine S-methyltransferase [Promethearchaeota archaeon]|nr:MAG: methylated-DNA--[protein]-cysteine S-methyltransferase [Candidatus Lokiarchaeota archaeon]
MDYRFYNTFSSPFDTFTIVWKENGSELIIQRIFLSDPELKSEVKALESFKKIELGSSLSIMSLGEKIQRFFKGEDVKFDLAVLDFTKCSEVQKRVLIAENGIPRGWVSVYKRIANHIGIKNGARVVGNALASNPFPIVIPCHRAIKTNGELGGYQGGTKMKRILLEIEGIEFSDRGKVITDRIYY